MHKLKATWTYRIALVVIGGLSIFTCACSSGGVDDGVVRSAIESSGPMNLAGEQVSIAQQQVDCGVQNDLWDPPTGYGTDHSIARLQQKGRNLKFSDDVQVSEPGLRQPWVQITGAFPLVMLDSANVKDGDKGSKIADVKTGVVIQHTCFPNPLPLMGVRHGVRTPDVPPSFRLKQNGNDWVMDRLLH